MDAPLFDLNYGLPDIQLKLEFPIEIVNEDNNGTQAGAGDSLMRGEVALPQQRAISISTRHLSAGVGANGKSFARARRRPCRICAPVSRAEKLGEVDALWQHRLLVAKRARNAQLLLRGCRGRT